MKKHRITYWVSTGIIFLFEGVAPALTSQTEMAKEGMRHLGYPQYFGVALAVFKVLGALALIIPQVPARVKEWAYAGFTFSLLFASISNYAVTGLNGGVFFPLIILAILMTSYWSFHKLNERPFVNAV
jgi:hypothetical protein